MYEKKKILRSRLSTSFFSGATENKMNFDIAAEKQKQFQQF
jgi:hypothetical protein